jgi:CBS domain-containing protein
MKNTDTIEMVLKSKGESKVVSIAPEESVFAALEKMAAHNIGALLVLSNHRVAGILSERDYARRGDLKGLDAKQTKVSQIMTTPVHCVSPRQTVDECMAIMTQKHFRHLPVLQDEAVVGLVSIGDMVKWVIFGQERTIQELQGYITGSYPA